MQAATAGIQAAKTMLSKRTRQVKVNLPSGYRVWLQIK
jgi:cobalamin biosynthesis protein CbiD